MNEVAQKVAIAAACLALICVQLVSGSVLCRGAGGHQAIEPIHRAGHCQSEMPDRHAEDHGSEPCQDVPIGGDQIVQTVRDASAHVSSHVACEVSFALHVDVLTAGLALSPPLRAGHLPPRSGGGPELLRTVILVI